MSQLERCSRPDTGHQEGVVPFALALFWSVSRSLNHRSDERASAEAGYRSDAAKKHIPF